MEDQIIVWEMPDGAVLYATCPARIKKPGETKSEWLLRQFNKTTRDNFPGAKRILNAVMPDGQPFTPGATKLFYSAWRHAGGGNITIDMPTARTIRIGEIRAERNRKLDASDELKARVDEIGSGQQQEDLKAYRQSLRDIPQKTKLDTLKTPESLEAFQPDWPVSS